MHIIHIHTGILKCNAPQIKFQFSVIKNIVSQSRFIFVQNEDCRVELLCAVCISCADLLS